MSCFEDLPKHRFFLLPELILRSCPPSPFLSMEQLADLEPDLFVSDQKRFESEIEAELALSFGYASLRAAWQLGHDLTEWSQVCYQNFRSRPELAPLFRNAVWPPLYRESFFELLRAKNLGLEPSAINEALGIRLAFGQIPKAEFLTHELLLDFRAPIFTKTYDDWKKLRTPTVRLPPERFELSLIRLQHIV